MEPLRSYLLCLAALQNVLTFIFFLLQHFPPQNALGIYGIELRNLVQVQKVVLP